MNRQLLAATGLVIATAFSSGSAHAKKSCDELKSELEAKIQGKGVKSFTLTVVPADEKTELRVVGTCEGGAKKITYQRARAAKS